jgi:hypothetical protein
LGVNAPTIDSICGTGSTEMRQASPVFDAAKQQGIAVGELHCAGVEDAIDRIRPIFPAKNGIGRMTGKQGSFCIHFRIGLFRNGVFRRYSGKDN